jgi:predicted PhzF superfamily epimerase YddE/YHI9
LRQLGLVTPPVELILHQGDDMGRPSVLYVEIPLAGGIRVKGKGMAIED